jgi:hypothetical protein
MGLIAIIAGVFGATAIRERSAMHEKWRYLAELFNILIQTDPGQKRNHIEACLAYDILTMEMWAHKSFRYMFKEILFEALRAEGTYPSLSGKQLEKKIENGIEYREAERVLAKLTEKRAPRGLQNGKRYLASTPSPLLPSVQLYSRVAARRRRP